MQNKELYAIEYDAENNYFIKAPQQWEAKRAYPTRVVKKNEVTLGDVFIADLGLHQYCISIYSHKKQVFLARLGLDGLAKPYPLLHSKRTDDRSEGKGLSKLLTSILMGGIHKQQHKASKVQGKIAINNRGSFKSRAFAISPQTNLPFSVNFDPTTVEMRGNDVPHWTVTTDLNQPVDFTCVEAAFAAFIRESEQYLQSNL